MEVFQIVALIAAGFFTCRVAQYVWKDYKYKIKRKFGFKSGLDKFEYKV